MGTPSTSRQGSQLIERLDAAGTRLQAIGIESDHLFRLASLGTIAAGVAHEINNILTPIVNYLAMARANPEDAILREKAIESAMRGSQRIADIVEALLGFSSPEDTTTCANIAQSLRGALDCIGRETAKDGVELRQAIADDCCAAISPLWLEQIFLNLILNATTAVKAAGGGVIEVRASRINNDTIEIVIVDSGQGLDPAVHANLFQPFVTTKNNSRNGNKTGGSGLGLAICRDLIERAGGAISARNADGSGAEFKIILPTPSSR